MLVLALWLVATSAFASTAAREGARTFRVGDHAFDVASPPDFVEPLTIPDQWDDAAAAGGGVAFAPDARWRLWLTDTQVDRRGGQRVRYVDYAYEAVAQELVSDAARLQVDFSPEFERLTLHGVDLRRGGAWSSRLAPERVTLARREAGFEQDMATGTVTALLVLDDVRAGDVVRVRYTVTGANPILAGQISESAGFGWVQPQLRRRLRVLFAPGTEIVDRVPASVPARREPARADAREVVYEQARIPALRDELIYPRWFDPVPSVIVGERRGWDDVATWAATLYPPPGPLPDGLRTRIAQWRALPDDDARVAAALRAVQEEVRYFGVEIGDSTHRPAEPAVVWERRYGACKDKVRLLVTVLGELGIAAEPALVSAERGRGIADLPPSGSVFDHVIARVHLHDAVLWLDPTMTQQRGSPRQLAVGNFGLALPVAPGSAALVPIVRPAAAIDATRSVETFAIEGDTVVLSVDTEYRGQAAERQRLLLVVNGKETVERSYADHYRRMFGEIEVDEPLAHEDIASENLVRTRERYRLTAPWAATTPGHRLLDVHADQIGSTTELPGVLERSAPLPLSHPLLIEQVTRIQLPSDWRWSGRDEDTTIEDPALHFSVKTRRDDDGTIRIERRLRSLAEAVPVASQREHFRVRRAINEALSTRVALTPPAADAARERSKRLNGLVRDLMDERSRRGRSDVD